MSRLSLLRAASLICLLLSFSGLVRSQPLPRSTPEAEGIDSAGILALVEGLAKERKRLTGTTSAQR
jgi:hypothetical protein